MAEMNRRLVVAVLVGVCACALPGSARPFENARADLLDRLRSWRADHGGTRGSALGQGATPLPADAKIERPGDYRFSIEFGGMTRQYRIHVPAGYSSSRPTPMVLAFHGGGGNMDLQADDRYYGLESKSDRAGFIAVFPNGYSPLRSGKLATWNAGNCCAGARDRNVDDVGFVRRIVQNLRAQLNVDPNRIFATGMSNGAMFAYRLACEMSDTIKAIASVAGSDGTRTCTPSRPVSILEIHAKDDERVLFEGGAGHPSPRTADYVSVPATIAKWVRRDGCAPVPKRVLEVPGAYCDAYAPCRDDAEVELCVTASGGHSWPGGRKVRTGAPGSTAISADDVMWDFFESRR
jgi:polyhydroxybutyrate depolymerase